MEQGSPEASGGVHILQGSCAAQWETILFHHLPVSGASGHDPQIPATLHSTGSEVLPCSPPERAVFTVAFDFVPCYNDHVFWHGLRVYTTAKKYSALGPFPFVCCADSIHSKRLTGKSVSLSSNQSGQNTHPLQSAATAMIVIAMISSISCCTFIPCLSSLRSLKNNRMFITIITSLSLFVMNLLKFFW